MSKKHLLSVVLLVCNPCLLAQQKSPSSQPGGSPPSGDMLAGCVQRAGMEYTLTDKDGVLHHLTGGKNMKHYVDHVVEVYGTNSTRTIDTSSYGVASSAKEQAVFQIKSVKNLGSPCSTMAR